MSRKPASMTRPTRRMVYGCAWAVVWAIVTFAMLGPRKHSWVATATVGGVQIGRDTRTFGLLSYLVVEREHVPLTGQPPATGSAAATLVPHESVTLTWRPLHMFTTAAGVGFVSLLCVLAARRHIANRLPDGRCDQCGYDLRGSVDRNAVCPECGSQR